MHYEYLRSCVRHVEAKCRTATRQHVEATDNLYSIGHVECYKLPVASTCCWCGRGLRQNRIAQLYDYHDSRIMNKVTCHTDTDRRRVMVIPQYNRLCYTVVIRIIFVYLLNADVNNSSFFLRTDVVNKECYIDRYSYLYSAYKSKESLGDRL